MEQIFGPTRPRQREGAHLASSRSDSTSGASDEADCAGVARLALLASALSRRPLQVARGEPGQPAWTDGKVVFLAPDDSPRRQLEALAVQASLLAAGSLAPDIARRLARRPELARRYLAVEGHRALAALGDLLPPSLRPLVDPAVAGIAGSPAASLAAARSRDAIGDPPESFGTIRARRLLASAERTRRTHALPAPVPTERPGPALAELAEDEEDQGVTAPDVFSSPAGGGGALGRLLRHLLAAVHRVDGGGPPGAAPPTHRTRAGARGAGIVPRSTRMAGWLEEADAGARGVAYPEWDVHRRRYRPAWCTVQELDVSPRDDAPLVLASGPDLRRPLARLGLGLHRQHRQPQGDDVDIDAAVEARVETMAGSAPDEAVYVDSLRRRRDLAVLLLLDISGSTAEPAAAGGTVHELQRSATAALAGALHGIGDRVALYAFRSQGRSAVQLLPVKRFDEDLDSLVMRRLHSLVPSAYSRLGAAIRHGTAVLEDRGGTQRRLLVVLSDGLAYDHGYEPAHGAADARRALSEARRRGVGCVCLSVGASTDGEVLRRVFGSAAHATLPAPEQLGRIIGPLFRSALRSAEGRRRVPAGRRETRRKEVGQEETRREEAK